MRMRNRVDLLKMLELEEVRSDVLRRLIIKKEAGVGPYGVDTWRINRLEQEKIRRRVEVHSKAVFYTHAPRSLGRSEVSPRPLLEKYRKMLKGFEGLEKQELGRV